MGVLLTIYSNDGQTILFQDSDDLQWHITVTSTGATLVNDDSPSSPITFTYSAGGTFAGFADTANSTTATYTNGTTFTPTQVSMTQTTYVVLAPTTYKKMTYDGNKVQVESAIRDGNGVKIDTNYAKTSDLSSKEAKGYITINGTSYQIRTSSTDSGAAGYITFVLE